MKSANNHFNNSVNTILCEFNYCIYNKKGKCSLNVISISPLGMCDDCIIPDFDVEALEKYKKETLERIELRMINAKR